METNLPTIENNLPTEQTAGAVAVASRNQAQIQSQIAIAKRFPRDESGAYAKAVRSFESPTLAEESMYRFEVGKNAIDGPSVHSARVLARCWTNVNYGCDCLSEDDHGAQLRGYAHDLENNLMPTQEAYVRRLVPRKNYKTGITEYVRPSELEWQREKNKQGAILERNCLLKLFPRDMVEECMAAGKKALERVAETGLKTSRESFLRKLVQKFDEVGVSAKMLERRLGHSLDLMDKAEAAELQGIYKAIKDGQASRTDYFVFSDTDLSEADKPASPEK